MTECMSEDFEEVSEMVLVEEADASFERGSYDQRPIGLGDPDSNRV